VGLILGKRKYNRGHRVEGVWIVAGVERTRERRVFLVKVERRDAATLIDIIQQHVRAGSIVHTDLWRGYSGITEETGLEHRTVNHSAFFKDPQTGVHTNCIEGTNFALKSKIPIRCRVVDHVDEHLLEFIWRRNNVNSLWDSFIHAIKEIHYDLQ
jgi:transposase-like protein